MNGEQVLALGLAPDCVPQTLLLQRAKAVAEELHDRRPLALMLAKKLLYAGLSTSQECVILMKKLSLCVLLDSADKDEGIRSFLEKRWPVFTGY